VGKKQRDCDPADPDDDHRGDCWDYAAFDPEHELVSAVVPGARTEEDAPAIVAEVGRRAGCDPPPLMTGDEYPAYATAIAEVFSEPVPAPPRGKPGRPRVAPERRLPDDVTDATAHKQREGDRVIAVGQRQAFGTPEGPGGALGESAVSHRVNTSFVEGHNGADRGRNAGQARKTYRFRKDRQVHAAMTYLAMYSYNFCRCVRTLRVKDEQGRSPALAAGLTDRVWTWKQWFGRPAVQSP
jgi:hypothetical protein